MSSAIAVQASEPDNYYGYRSYKIGKFEFSRDEYFVKVKWPKGSHLMAADVFLRALQRDVAWNFFYGTVNFDHVFGTLNHYGTVDMFAGRFNDAYRKAGLDYVETHKSDDLVATFKAILQDWTNQGYDPFAAPEETANPYGRKNGDNLAAITRQRVTAQRMVGAAGDTPVRSDKNGYPVNRHFADVPQDQPEIHAEKGFEDEVRGFNLFGYLSRSDVTWNPSVCSVVRESLYCPTSEEFILPVEHGNDRVEWFLQLSDEITWVVKDKETGAPRANVTMRAGDIAAMPADIRHQGYSPKRSMLLVWENNSGKIPALIAEGKAPVTPVKF